MPTAASSAEQVLHAHGLRVDWLRRTQSFVSLLVGSVRQLPSGRWLARYPGVDGRLRPAPETFASRQEAAGWLAQRFDLRPSTREVYAAAGAADAGAGSCDR